MLRGLGVDGEPLAGQAGGEAGNKGHLHVGKDDEDVPGC